MKNDRGHGRSIGPESGLLLNLGVGDEFTGPIREAKGVGAGEEVIGNDAQASAAVALLGPVTEEAAAFLSQRAIQPEKSGRTWPIDRQPVLNVMRAGL